MQAIRAAFPIAIWYKSSSTYFLFATFAFGLITPLFVSLLKFKRFHYLTIGGLAFVRISDVLVRDADADLWLSMIGVSLFALALPVLLKPQLSEARNRCSGTWAGGLLIGIAADTTIQGVFWTNNLGSGSNLIAILVQLLLTGIAFVLLGLHQIQAEEEWVDRSWSSALLFIIFGPYFLLQFLFFQDQGYISEILGIKLPLALIFIMLSNLASIIGFYVGRLKPSTPKLLGVLKGLIIAASILLNDRMPQLIPISLPLAQYSLGWGLSRLEMYGKSEKTKFLTRTSVSVGFGQILFILLLLVSFGNLALSAELPSEAGMSIIALLLGGSVILADQMLKGANLASTKYASLVGIIMVLTVISIFPLLGQMLRKNSEVDPSPPIRVMTYNIHSAVSLKHGQDPEAIAQVIQEGGADIIALQEIGRGWLISGGIDMVSWLSNRLGMEAIFAGTADTIWGNSILSRYPILESGSGSLPMLDSKIPRGYIWAKIDIGGPSPLLIINTHLQNGAEEQDVRLAQVPTLLDFWNNSASSILLGDLNASPDTEELNLIADSGFVDSWDEIGVGSGNTIPVEQPSGRLDWIWHTRDLFAVEALVIPTQASDHLPVIALIDFIGR